MRSLCLIACLALLTTTAIADDGADYMRNRGHGGWHGGYGGYGYGYGYGQPFYGGYYYPPPIYGSFYARPYPTHLDYFRLRGTPIPACPCTEVTPFVPDQSPAPATPEI